MPPIESEFYQALGPPWTWWSYYMQCASGSYPRSWHFMVSQLCYTKMESDIELNEQFTLCILCSRWPSGCVFYMQGSSGRLSLTETVIQFGSDAEHFYT